MWKWQILRQVWLFSLVIALSGTSAHAGKIIGFGAQVGVGSMPYPAILGVGPAVTLLDMVRLGASVGVFEPLVAWITGDHAWNYGFEARVKLPFLRVSPMVALGYSRYSIDAPKTAIFGRRKTTESYLTPEAGLEVKITDRFYAGGGASMPLSKENDAWKSKNYSTTFGKLPIIFFGYAGFAL